MIVYRVITDEPIGICVGFPPPREYEFDQFPLVSDDGGHNVFIIDNKVVISSAPQMNGQYPEPDLEIWRSPDEFDRWTKGMNGLGEDAMKTLTVTETAEIILDGNKYLLEKGDKIQIEAIDQADLDAAMTRISAADQSIRSEVNFNEIMNMAKRFGGLEKSPDPKVLAFTFSRFNRGRDAFEQWLDTKGIPHRDWGGAVAISLYDVPNESKKPGESINEAGSKVARTEDGEEITCSYCGKPIMLGEGAEVTLAQINRIPHTFDPTTDEYYHYECLRNHMNEILPQLLRQS